MMHLHRFESLWALLASITGRTFAACANIGQMIAMLDDATDREPGETIRFKPDLWAVLKSDLDDVAQIAQGLDLDATIESIRYAVMVWERGIPIGNCVALSKNETERLCWSLQSVRMNFATQMQSRLVLVMDTKHAHYLTCNDPPFGRLVEDVFPLASEEIVEAAKCLALQRPTAVVFHLMRAMELGIQRIAQSLGKTMVQKVWATFFLTYLKKLKPCPKDRGGMRGQHVTPTFTMSNRHGGTIRCTRKLLIQNLKRKPFSKQ